uniref:Uncharacterized protein n=1 Tax=Pararge aegeria TaxID=116150 RepID=S4NIQ6_9NEOP
MMLYFNDFQVKRSILTKTTINIIRYIAYSGASGTSVVRNRIAIGSIITSNLQHAGSFKKRVLYCHRMSLRSVPQH